MVASAGWARARRLDVRKEAVSGDSCGYSAGASGGLVQRSRRINSLKSGGPMPQSGSFLPWPCNWPRKFVENPRVRVTLAVSRAARARKTLLLQRAAITTSGFPKLLFLGVASIAAARHTVFCCHCPVNHAPGHRQPPAAGRGEEGCAAKAPAQSVLPLPALRLHRAGLARLRAPPTQ